MKAWLLITAAVLVILVAGMYFFVLPQAVEQRATTITADLKAASERQAAACDQLAQRVYMRDFAIICARSQTASSTPCSSDLNAAIAYGIYQQQDKPTGDLAKLYSSYTEDIASCKTK